MGQNLNRHISEDMHMKRDASSLGIKNAHWYPSEGTLHIHPIAMINERRMTRYWRRGRLWTLIYNGWDCEKVQSFYKNWQSLKKISTSTYQIPATLHVKIDPRELKASSYTKTCTQSFRAANTLRSQSWERPRCPTAAGPTNKMSCIRRADYYSLITPPQSWLSSPAVSVWMVPVDTPSSEHCRLWWLTGSWCLPLSFHL